MFPIKVLVVDDSALIRSLLTEILDRQPDIKVVGTAPDPLVAREMIKQLNPDVLTLDVEMPRMDGLDFLERLMRLRPMPVVMISSRTERGSDITLRALELGAVDFITKPKLGIASGLEEYAELIAEKIRTAASATCRRRTQALATVPALLTADAVLPAATLRQTTTQQLVVIGASTGGTEAIRHVLLGLPADCPGVLIAQHMPEGFTRSFAERLDSLCSLHVKEACDGERILSGHAYIAPGSRHLLIKRSGSGYVAELNDGPLVNRHRPSVDVLFRSVANCAGANAIGVILTGMGNDGAQGLLEMKQAGAHTFAQDEASCVVYGMPREAVARGAVDEIVPLEAIASRVLRQLSTRASSAPATMATTATAPAHAASAAPPAVAAALSSTGTE